MIKLFSRKRGKNPIRRRTKKLTFILLNRWNFVLKRTDFSSFAVFGNRNYRKKKQNIHCIHIITIYKYKFLFLKKYCNKSFSNFQIFKLNKTLTVIELDDLKWIFDQPGHFDEVESFPKQAKRRKKCQDHECIWMYCFDQGKKN